MRWSIPIAVARRGAESGRTPPCRRHLDRCVLRLIAHGLGERLRGCVMAAQRNWGRDLELTRRRLLRSPMSCGDHDVTHRRTARLQLVFTAVDKILLEPLPYQDPGDLYKVWADVPHQRDSGPAVGTTNRGTAEGGRRHRRCGGLQLWKRRDSSRRQQGRVPHQHDGQHAQPLRSARCSACARPCLQTRRGRPMANLHCAQRWHVEAPGRRPRNRREATQDRTRHAHRRRCHGTRVRVHVLAVADARRLRTGSPGPRHREPAEHRR